MAASAPFAFTLATLNCYLIPKLAVNRANATCREQERRACGIGRWLGTVHLAGLQEVWGSHCHEMERHAALGGRRLLFASLKSTVLDTLSVYAVNRTGGLQLAYDEEKFELVAFGKRTFEHSISRSNKGVLAALLRCRQEPKYVLLFNLHLDHVNVAGSQREQLAEVRRFVQDVGDELFGAEGGGGGRALRPVPNGSLECSLAVSEGRLDPGRTAAFVVGDFNIDGGARGELPEARRQRLRADNAATASAIRAYLREAARSSGAIRAYLRKSGLLDWILYPREDASPAAMAAYLETAPLDEQESLYLEMLSALGDPGADASAGAVIDLHREHGRGGSDTYSSEDNAMAEYATRRLDYIFALRRLGGRRLLEPEVEEVRTVRQSRGEELSDHWGVVASLRI